MPGVSPVHLLLPAALPSLLVWSFSGLHLHYIPRIFSKHTYKAIENNFKSKHTFSLDNFLVALFFTTVKRQEILPRSYIV